jgi:hypothetical protein
MKFGNVLIAVALSSGAYGCGIAKYGTHNLIEEPLDQVNELAECVRNKHMADAAWTQFENADPEHIYTVHFARGFKEGYVDYLHAGGTGEPPVAPPWRYRKVGYETLEGVQAIGDWFAGFRQGSYAAYATGYREFVVLPVAVLGMPAAYASQAAAQPAPVEQVLPPPQVMPEEKPMPAPVEQALPPPQRPEEKPIPPAPVGQALPPPQWPEGYRQFVVVPVAGMSAAHASQVAAPPAPVEQTPPPPQWPEEKPMPRAP